jgi:virginiamycin B lyase
VRRGIGHWIAWLSLGLAISALIGASTAAGAVYWATGNRIGAANLDGSQSNQRYFKPPFPADSAGPECGLAVTSTYLYWVGAFGIGRVNLEGPAVPETLVGGLRRPCGIALDGTYFYWANREAGSIGRARLDGSEVNPAFLGGLNGPCNVAVAGGRLYWLDWSGIGRANLDGSEPEAGLVTTVGGCGLAVDAGHLYWGQSGAIGRANLDGSEPDPGFISRVGAVAALALDSGHLYWTDQPEGMSYASIGRASLDGSGAIRSWIPTESFTLGGLAVDARPSPPPLPLPSQPFWFGQTRRNTRLGNAVVDVWVPERGDLSLLSPKLGWKVLKGPEPPPWRGGSFRWRLKIWPGPGAKGKQVRIELRNKGWAKVALRVAYAEVGQLPTTALKRLTLRKRQPR